MNKVSTQYLWQLDAQVMAKGIRDREFSSKEVVESCLQRIERTNPVINAMNEVRPGAALGAAELADKAVAASGRISFMAFITGLVCSIRCRQDSTTSFELNLALWRHYLRAVMPSGKTGFNDSLWT